MVRILVVVSAILAGCASVPETRADKPNRASLTAICNAPNELAHFIIEATGPGVYKIDVPPGTVLCPCNQDVATCT